ncbi:NAD-dependent epimerase/dehydratase family protein [Cohnella cellulosilytica]|uniref:NAD-dependent epimerase/dehydratase family protein n=1 Tax=Cohnella cellulosilytica TaxID=986710 RepID=A0ABW2F787_9BACL
MNIFVTGGTGFIGSYVVNDLLKLGHRVNILARNPRKVSGFLGSEAISFTEGTLTDREAIRRGLEGCDAVIHIALGWGDTAVDMMGADTLPSLYIFETAASLGIRNMIYTSSIAAYGEARDVFDEHTSTRPTDFYGATKAATENFFLAMAQVYGIRCNVIRPGYTFGNPVVDGASIYTDMKIRNFVRAAKAGEPIHLIRDDGTQFIWAGDLAKIYTAVLGSDHNRQLFTGVSTEFTTWADVARIAVDYVGSSSEIVLEDKGRDPRKGRNDVSQIEKEFGFKFVTGERMREHVAYLADVVEA